MLNWFKKKETKENQEDPELYYTEAYKKILAENRQQQLANKERNKKLVLEHHPEAVYSDTPQKFYWPGQGTRESFAVYSSPVMSGPIAEGKTQEEMWERAAKQIIYQKAWKEWNENY